MVNSNAVKALYRLCLVVALSGVAPIMLLADPPAPTTGAIQFPTTDGETQYCNHNASSEAKLQCEACQQRQAGVNDDKPDRRRDERSGTVQIVQTGATEDHGELVLAEVVPVQSAGGDAPMWTPGASSDPVTWGAQDPGNGFQVGGLYNSARSIPPALLPRAASDPMTWGAQDPGNGFLVGRTDEGQLSLSAYALLRYMNQMGDETFIDHLGREQNVDLRHDIYSHRILVYLKGWLMDPDFLYNIAFWTVNTTDQDALFANFGYRFCKKFNLYGGINGTPGSRSMQGSHPYWLGHDRVMADEFFRPFFAQGIWANGELLPGLWYNTMVGNTSSTLGVTASAIDRKFTYGGSMWWMPTTHEFGPRGAYGDWEMHDELATRFGFSTAFSPEERYSVIAERPDNTTLKLADSLNLFATGSLAPGVTVSNADYKILAFDAGLKYRGLFLQVEFYQRWLDGFVADGSLPVDQINDWGFYVQSSIYLVPRALELYAATSQIYGDKDAGFDDSSEYIVGTNYYPWDSRNYRVNLQLMDVNHSPVSSTFGYYTGGQNGATVSTAVSVLF